MIIYNLNQSYMNINKIASSLIPNIYELDELPFLKKQTSQWKRFKDKQKFMPLLRGLTYTCQSCMAKIFLFMLSEDKKEKKIQRYLHILTERQILSLEQFYQILNQNLTQAEFSCEVQGIKIFQMKLIQYVNCCLSKHFISFKQQHDFLNFHIYKEKEEYKIKATFKHFKFNLQMDVENQSSQLPTSYVIQNPLVKQQLLKKYLQLEKQSRSLTIPQDLPLWYKAFYDDVYFVYDDFVLKLQVFHNFPLLRIKNYIPIKFIDYKTNQPLEGLIFSNSNLDCMYGHFSGYNAESTKVIEGQYCSGCQLFIYQFQQNQLLMMLRDNIANPSKETIYYCPQYNRFKIIKKTLVTVEQEQEGGLIEEKKIVRTSLSYLNYYHFRINLKKMTNKNRIPFNPNNREETFPLSFPLVNRNHVIVDPARGRLCQHFSFTDLRLYYLNFNPQTNTYKCPIQGCEEVMFDNDILYLKQVVVLLDYAKYKCQQWPQLTEYSNIVVDNENKKVFVNYRTRDQGNIITKMDEIVDYYKTLVDPYYKFPEYRLGIKEKERKERMDQYMFAGLRQEMKSQMRDEQEEEDEDEDS